MNIFKKLFGSKEKEKEEQEEIEEQLQEEPKQESEYPLCDQCGMEIKPDHFLCNFAGKKFHKQCLRQLRKIAKRGGVINR